MHLTGAPRLTYIFHEWDDHLALCPISHLTALVLVDEAFQALEIQSAQDVLPIEVSRAPLQLTAEAEAGDV
jgi:Protein of unknown function (DUF3435)